MARLYFLVVFLQIFCLYHAYKRNEEQRWYIFIFIFPFLGSVAYLYHAFYSKNNVNAIREELSNTIDTDRKLNQLRQRIKYSDTVSNKLALGDEYLRRGHFNEALEVYQSCQEGIYEDDPSVVKRIIRAAYEAGEYDIAINNKHHLSSKEEVFEKVFIALSHQQLNHLDEAEEVFKEVDHRFENYPQRKEFVHFLKNVGRVGEAREKALEMLAEIDAMTREEKRDKKPIVRELQAFLKEA